MTKHKTTTIFLVLGIVWVVVGLVIYQNSSVWPLGFVFLIIGAIGKWKERAADDE